jgi:hypothetical protein
MTRLQETATVIPFRRFGAPVNGIHDSDRVLLRLVEDARIAPITPTTIERHYARQARQAHRVERWQAGITVFCFAVVAWIVAIFAAAYIGGAA